MERLNSRATDFLMGAFDHSIKNIGCALALEHKHVGAMSELGEILIHQGHLQQALEIYRRSLT